MKSRKIYLFLILFITTFAATLILEFALNTCFPQYKYIYLYSHHFKVLNLISVLTPVIISGFFLGFSTNKFRKNMPFTITTWGYYLLVLIIYWKYRGFLRTDTSDLLEIALVWLLSTGLHLLSLFLGAKLKQMKKDL